MAFKKGFNHRMLTYKLLEKLKHSGKVILEDFLEMVEVLENVKTFWKSDSRRLFRNSGSTGKCLLICRII